MLKGIPLVISPELLKILAEMGHGDTITIGDAYFAAASMAKDGILIRADGMAADTMVDAILQLMPLDNMAESSVTVMGIPDEKGGLVPLNAPEKVLKVIEKYDQQAAQTCQVVDRFAFYEQAKKSYAVLATGVENEFGCIILQKGVM